MKIVVYCSSQAGLEEKYQQLARDLGAWIGQNGHSLLYGGSNAGLMHITAAAAHEAGGHVIGVIPEMFRQRIDPVCDEVVYTANLGDRKQYMIEHGDVFVVMPGGIGTLDEWMSTLAVMTIGNDDPRPIIAANIDLLIKGVHLRFRPEGAGTPDEKLTSRALKDQCVFEAYQLVESKTKEVDGKMKTYQERTPLSTYAIATAEEP